MRRWLVAAAVLCGGSLGALAQRPSPQQLEDARAYVNTEYAEQIRTIFTVQLAERCGVIDALDHSRALTNLAIDLQDLANRNGLVSDLNMRGQGFVTRQMQQNLPQLRSTPCSSLTPEQRGAMRELVRRMLW
jgi:hypothetical protein